MVKEANQLKIGGILSYLQMAIGIVIGLLYTPVMIRLLGKSEYGLYNTIYSTLSMLSILSLGFNSSYIKFYSKYKKENDQESIYKLNGLFLLLFVIIGVIALICGLTISFHLEWVFDTGLTVAEYKIAKVLSLLLTFNLAVSFPMSVFSNIITAHEKFIFLKLVSIIKTVVNPLFTVLLLFAGYRSIAMVSVTILVTLIADMIYFIYLKRNLKIRFIFHGFEKGIIKNLFVYTSFIAINIVVDQINYNIDNFLLGRFKGTQVVAVYAVGYTLYQYYMMFSTAISGVFTPRIHKIINETNGDTVSQKRELTDLFIKVGRVQFLVLALIASGMVFFGKPFIYYWAGQGYEEAYFVTLLLIIPSSIALIQNVGIEIQRAQNNHHFRSIAYLIMACVNLVVSIFLCQKYGAIGSAIGTAISLLLANGFIMNIYYHKKCNIDILLFWKNILRMTIGLLIPIVFGVILVYFVDLYSIWKLLLSIFSYTLIYIGSMWLLGMNIYEKSLVSSLIKRIKK